MLAQLGREGEVLFETEFPEFEELAHRRLDALAALREESPVLLLDETFCFRVFAGEALVALDENNREAGFFNFLARRNDGTSAVIPLTPSGA